MKLVRKGVNDRGRVEWMDEDYGLTMEEWQVNNYRQLVEQIEGSIGRKLRNEEAGTIEWLSGSADDTIKRIMGFVTDAHRFGYISGEKDAK